TLPALGTGRTVSFGKQVELELGSEVAAIATLGEPLDLFAEDGARRMWQILVRMVIEDVAQHQGRLFQPGHAADSGKIRLQDEIAIALGPACRLVARHRLHIDVVGQQVVAAMRLVISGFDEEGGEEALADEPPLHIHGGYQHGVDLICRHCTLQLIERKFPGHPLSSPTRWIVFENGVRPPKRRPDKAYYDGAQP